MKMIPTKRHRAEPAASPRSQPVADSAAIGGDELGARAYVKAALGETDILAPRRRSHHTDVEGEGQPRAVALGVEVHHHYYYAETQAPTADRDRVFSGPGTVRPGRSLPSTLRFRSGRRSLPAHSWPTGRAASDAAGPGGDLSPPSGVERKRRPRGSDISSL